MPIPQRDIASVYAVHTVGALFVWSPVNFRDGIVQKPCSPLRAIPPLGSAHEAQGRVCSPREIFLSMRIGGDGSPYSPLQLIATP